MAKLKGNAQAIYNLGGQTLSDGAETGLFLDSTGALMTNAVFTTGDIQIGAVELKDGTTDARVTAKVDNAAAGTPTPLSVGGKYNATPPTYDDGDQVTGQYDVKGNQFVNLGTKLDNVNDSITTYPFGHNYAHISTATTTIVKSGAGVLHNISVNTLGTVASVTTVYDNTAGSGTVIAVINTLALSGAFVLDVAFSTGLTLVTTGTVAPDITVSYR